MNDTDRERDERMELTKRLLTVVESMKKLGISRVNLSAEGKVQTETVTERTYWISCNPCDPYAEE